MNPSINQNAARLFDKLWFREDIAWPENDRPQEPRTTRIFNLIYGPHFVSPNQFWQDYDRYKIEGKWPLFVEFETTAPQVTYTTSETFIAQIHDGLELWKERGTVRFAEELTSFFGIGHPNSKKFRPTVPENTPQFSTVPAEWLTPELTKTLEEYNLYRASCSK